MKKLLTTSAIVLTLAMAPFAVLAQNSEANVWKNSGPETTVPVDRPASVNVTRTVTEVPTKSGVVNVICTGNLEQPIDNLRSITLSSSFDRVGNSENDDQSIWEYFTSNDNELKSVYPVELTLNGVNTIEGNQNTKLTFPAESVSGALTPNGDNSQHADIDMSVDHDNTSLEINLDTTTSMGTLIAENVGSNEIDFQVPISCNVGR